MYSAFHRSWLSCSISWCKHPFFFFFSSLIVRSAIVLCWQLKPEISVALILSDIWMFIFSLDIFPSLIVFTYFKIEIQKKWSVHDSLTITKILMLLANSYNIRYGDDTWMSEIRYTFHLHPPKLYFHCFSYVPIALKTQKIERDFLNSSRNIFFFFFFFSFQTGSHF